MCNSINLCGGAFVATFEKGEKGKPGRWVTKAVPVNKKKKHDGREAPQYPIVEKIEEVSKLDFQDGLKAMTLDIVKHLKAIK